MSLLGTLPTKPVFLFFTVCKIILDCALFGGVIWSAYPIVIGTLYSNFGLFKEIAQNMAIHKVLWVQVVGILIFLIPSIFLTHNIIKNINNE